MHELNTFSIVARCPNTGMLGMAVSSAVPAAGALCLYGRAGIGAVSTQSWVNPYLAIDALDLIERGNSAQTALEQVVQQDADKHARQIGVVDAAGNSAAWTGEHCTDWAGHSLQPGGTIQGNMLSGSDVIDDMCVAFRESATLELSERLMLTLEAGQLAGGDKRGKQSAALKIYGRDAYAWLDLRVDEHREPIVELRRVLTVARRQLLPFVEHMPRRGQAAAALPDAVTDMLLMPPDERPGNGLEHSDPSGELFAADFESSRLKSNLEAFQPVLSEIKKLRTLDLSDVHPGVVFAPLVDEADSS